MELDNTSVFLDHEVLSVYRFLRPVVKPVVLRVRPIDDQPFAGWAQPGHLYVRVEVGDAVLFPWEQSVRPRGYLSLRLESPTEALVYVLAHELRHLWQYWNPRAKRLAGGRGHLSNRDADAWALERLTQWKGRLAREAVGR